MRLSLLNEIADPKYTPNGDAAFASAMRNAKETSEQVSFLESPEGVQKRALSIWPYEAIQGAVRIFPTPHMGEWWVVRHKDGTEMAVLPDGSDIEDCLDQEGEEKFADDDAVDWQMEQHYGKPEDYPGLGGQ